MTDGRDVARESARYLEGVYVPRLRRALDILPVEDLWWRPHPDSISFGTILLHLEGNVRQWILSGLGGAEDHRDRQAEFSTTDGPSAAQLISELADTVRAAAEVLEGLPEDGLRKLYRIQGTEVQGFAAVYHVVEHFSWHTGQAVYIAKARAGAGHDMHFYDDAQVNAAHNEPGA